jgi:hypothetical protein
MQPHPRPIHHDDGAPPASQTDAPPPEGPGSKPTPARSGRRLPLDERLVERGREARRALDQVCPDAAPDERILNELVAKQLPVALLLHELEEQLAARIMVVMDDPRIALAVAKVLRETAAMASAMTKRVQSTLSTAASLRAQRRFLTLHGRAPESKNDV